MDAHCQRCLYETGCRSNQHSDTLLPVSLPRNSNTPGGGGGGGGHGQGGGGGPVQIEGADRAEAPGEPPSP